MKCARLNRGFSLVELMVAMVLGLVVIGGVISVMLANKRSYRANEGLSQIQESARTAYELIARDIRQTGGTGCDNASRMSNALTNAGAWWQTWASVQGFDSSQTDTAVANGTTLALRVAGTDSIHMHSIEGGGFPVNVHDAGARTISLSNATATSLTTSDVLVICDFDHAALFRAGVYTGGTTTINYSVAGNCSSGLGFPVNCDGSIGNVYAFPRNAWVGRVSAVDWYIGNNDRPADGGRSLYRRRLGPGGVLTTEEVVAGVTNMQITFGRNGNDAIVDATAIVGAAAWANVNSVFITVTVTSGDSNISNDSAVNNGRLQRTFTYLITLRNRVP
jgi:type IV pilus assembly protein PilW